MRRALTILAIATALAAAPKQPPLGLDAYMPTPPNNPLTAEKSALGRKLFFDKRLSLDNTVSCATCHDPEVAFTDREAVAVGVRKQKGTRRSPRLVNRGYGQTFFWDGRAQSLEEQVLKPIENPIEMDLELGVALERIAADAAYVADFDASFEAGPSPETLAMALASYVRTIVSGDSPYDRYVAGDPSALTAQQQRGLELFRGKAACSVCHLGPNLTDEEFHNTGVGWKGGEPEDMGRFKVTEHPEDRGAFKTPTLREIASTGPYMHDGSLATLEDVIDFYSDGGEKNDYLDFDMQRLDLTDTEKADLVAFLQALTGEVREGVVPE